MQHSLRGLLARTALHSNLARQRLSGPIPLPPVLLSLAARKPGLHFRVKLVI